MYYIPRHTITLVRESSVSTESYPRFSNSTGIWITFRAYFTGLDREHFCAITLDGKNRLIGLNTVSIGTPNGALVYPREALKTAVLQSAVAIILMHNHPSGDPVPSSEDLAATKRICEAGQILGINCLDHIIFGGETYYSFADNNMLPKLIVTY